MANRDDSSSRSVRTASQVVVVPFRRRRTRRPWPRRPPSPLFPACAAQVLEHFVSESKDPLGAATENVGELDSQPPAWAAPRIRSPRPRLGCGPVHKGAHARHHGADGAPASKQRIQCHVGAHNSAEAPNTAPLRPKCAPVARLVRTTALKCPTRRPSVPTAHLRPRWCPQQR